MREIGRALRYIEQYIVYIWTTKYYQLFHIKNTRNVSWGLSGLSHFIVPRILPLKAHINYCCSFSRLSKWAASVYISLSQFGCRQVRSLNSSNVVRLFANKDCWGKKVKAQIENEVGNGETTPAVSTLEVNLPDNLEHTFLMVLACTVLLTLPINDSC